MWEKTRWREWRRSSTTRGKLEIALVNREELKDDDATVIILNFSVSEW